MNERAKLTDQELRDAAAEAGISPEELRQALSQRAGDSPGTAIAKSAGAAVQGYTAQAQLALSPDRAVEGVRAAIARQVGHRGHRQGNGDIDILDDRTGMLYRIHGSSDGQGGALVQVRSERTGSSLALAAVMFTTVALGVTVLGFLLSSLMMWLGIGLLLAGGAGVVMAGGRVAGMQRQAELVVAQALEEAEEAAPLSAGARALPPE
ncbi:hypothetical protein [Nannocystis sp.]|uniref:hypothetical protein n=1 Tax=Nannocystis sp. TaxID=1962667 RepID=UPI002427CD6C|nr:hypothetical protein [Nannocystis sp.]MBK7824599.1 hypothetical protein [Nannocystis sp.]MBK9753149.1 hypothetical protein [Nannocystis sp.]